MHSLVATAVERAMKLQEVILRALSGALTWVQAAEILGIDPRSLRRWRARYESDQQLGLYDRRRLPSHRKAPVGEVQKILRLYRETYHGFNVRHFHHLLRREHGVTLSYNFVRLALQEAGLVAKRRARGRHRRRREPRPCFGELLHLDGSPHAWLALRPGERQTLIAVLDDATKRLLYAQLWPSESLPAVMAALAHVFQTFGLPGVLYTDRASWAFYTPTAGGPVDRTHLTHVGRALARLGIEHIGAYSPQARGRGERLNRTLQDRLVNELRLAGITTLEAANAYLRDRFIPDYNATFTRAPADPATAFVPLGPSNSTKSSAKRKSAWWRRITPSPSTGSGCRSANNRAKRLMRAGASSSAATMMARIASGAARTASVASLPTARRCPGRPPRRQWPLLPRGCQPPAAFLGARGRPRRPPRRRGPRLPVGPKS